MSRNDDYDDEEGGDEDGEQFSDSDDDDGFKEDMEALRRACMITGTNLDDHDGTAGEAPSNSAIAGSGDEGCGVGDGVAWESDGEEDIKLFRSIRERFALSEDVREPLSMKPLCILPPLPSDDGDEEDFEIFRSIQRRFSAYEDSDTPKNYMEDLLRKPEQVHASDNGQARDNIADSVATANIILDSKEACEPVHLREDTAQPSTLAGRLQADACKSELPHNNSSFPESAQVLIDAIRKNRAYQRFIRSKLTHIEARIEENKKLKERFKILRDFQVSCKRLTGKALSQKKDPRVQLISAQRSRSADDCEVNDKKVSAMNSGPTENSHVANYRMALTKFPLSFPCKKWSAEERKNLAKGIRQQFQEMLLNVSMDRISATEGSSGDSNNLDNILTSIKDLKITPEMIRRFLPKVNWDNLASMYVTGHSGSECEARWLNWEDPLINCDPWTAEEDKNLLCIIQDKGITDWLDIAISLGTNRTPFQCLARYQRSLNACILKREWTEDEDDELRMAVEKFGEHNWQSVASLLKGRTGPQCSNRWKKSLHPTRLRVGLWNQDEDKHLKVAVILFGPKNWKKISQFVPGRTQVQCRERWVNCLDPSLNKGEWTKEEDSRLRAAIAEHGHCWSKVAAHLPSRTDNQCWRRWKALNPDKVPLVQEARRMRRTAFICNFVDRESERPKLDPKDFIPLAITDTPSETGNIMPSKRDGGNIMSSKKDRRKLSRGNAESKNGKDAATYKITQKVQSRRGRKRQRSETQQVTGITGGRDVETLDGDRTIERNRRKNLCLKQNRFSEAVGHHSSSFQKDGAIQRKKTIKSCLKKNKSSETVQDHSSPDQVSTFFTSNNGGTNTTSEKRFIQTHSRKGKHVVPDTDSETFVSLYPESVQSGIYGVEASGENNPTSRRTKVPRRRRSRRRCAEMGEEVQQAFNTVESDLDGDITLSHFMKNRLKKRRINSNDLPNIISDKADDNARHFVESTGGSMSMNLEHAHQTGNPTPVNNTAQDKEPTSRRTKVPCKRHSRRRCAEMDEEVQEALNTLEGDLDGYITLSHFMKNRSKKRRINASNDSPNIISEKADENVRHFVGFTGESMSMNLERAHQTENPIPVNITAQDKEPCRKDCGEDGIIATTEAVNTNLETDNEAGHITLAPFMHNNTNLVTDNEAGHVTLASFMHSERNRQGGIVSNDISMVLPADDACGGDQMATESLGTYPESAHAHESSDGPAVHVEISDKEPGRIDAAEGGSVGGSDAAHVNLEDNSVAEDFKLAHLVRKRLKRR